MTPTDWQTAAATLRLSARLVDGVQAGLAARGFSDVRPVHGFAFAALGGGGRTTSGLAGDLGISKQAAAQLVAHLVRCGYVVRRPDPHDGRAQHLVLTPRGIACTEAAEQAAADVVRGWRAELGPAASDALSAAVTALAGKGRMRPSW